MHWDVLVCLEEFEHDHNAYYHAHPAVLDGIFELITLVDQSLEGESWEPSGISCVLMHRTWGFHQRDRDILVKLCPDR